MVVLVDLDDDGSEEDTFERGNNQLAVIGNDNRPNPNFSLNFSAALSCYP